ARNRSDTHIRPLPRQTTPGTRAGLRGGLSFSLLELAHPRFERCQPVPRLLEQPLLRLEVLAHDEVHAIEPRGEECAQVLLDVLRRRVAQRLVDARAEVV